jgi:hypothetical protein
VTIERSEAIRELVEILGGEHGAAAVAVLADT